MKAMVLFSGGKDSGLATLLLEPFFDEMELVTFSFGRDDAWMKAAQAAAEIAERRQGAEALAALAEDVGQRRIGVGIYFRRNSLRVFL